MGVAEGDDLLGRQVEAERIPPDREAVGQLLEQLDPPRRGPSGQDVLVEGDLRQVCEGGGGDGAPLAVVSPDSLVAHGTRSRALRSGDRRTNLHGDGPQLERLSLS